MKCDTLYSNLALCRRIEGAQNESQCDGPSPSAQFADGKGDMIGRFKGGNIRAHPIALIKTMGAKKPPG